MILIFPTFQFLFLGNSEIREVEAEGGVGVVVGEEAKCFGLQVVDMALALVLDLELRISWN